MSRLMPTVASVTGFYSPNDPRRRVTYHLRNGDGDDSVTYAPIWCGGSVMFPGPTAYVDAEQVCPDCTSAQQGAAS